MIPHVYVNAQCGSFRDHGVCGSCDDLVLQAIIRCSDNGDTDRMVMLISTNLVLPFDGRAFGLVPVASVDLPPSTIRIFRDGHLRAELYGWTP